MIKLKKFNYDINRIIGVEYLKENDKKELKKYYLDVKTKVIRKYHDSLRNPKNLICSYIDVEKTLSMRIKLKKDTLNKLTNLDKFIKTKIYTEFAPEEIIEYTFRYQIVELKNEEVAIEVVFLPKENFEKMFKEIVNLVGFVDYISFPAFSYKSLYQYGILEPMRDIFIIMLWDKSYITTYQDGKYMYNSLINFGMQNIYNELKSEFQIEGFNRELFIELLEKKGVDKSQYFDDEIEIYNFLKIKLKRFFNMINEEIKIIYKEYDIDNFDRIFLTTSKGNILGIEELLKEYFDFEGKKFDFYEKYNLDQLPITPFLYLSMIETYYAYKNNEQNLNFSIWKRPPTFFFRPTGQLVASFILGTFISISAVGGVKFCNSIKNKELNKIQTQIQEITNKKILLSTQKNELDIQLKDLSKEYAIKKAKIKNLMDTIDEIKNYKTNVLNYKTYNLKNIIEGLIRTQTKLENFKVEDNKFKLQIYSKNENNILSLFKFLKENGWKFNNKIIKFYQNDKNSYYISDIEIVKGS